MTPKIAVLVCVFNGARFLPEQIFSLGKQTHPRMDVWVSDDGSTDSSKQILLQSAADWRKGKFYLLDGPRLGFAENFRSLIINPSIEADYFAFCDQDDVWHSTKLAKALDWLSKQDKSRPALFASRTRIIDDEGNPLGYSPLFGRPPSFCNALVQSIAGGNTMVMNRAARELMAQASHRTSFVSHDWWCYLMITGAGGLVHYSPDAQIDYRQHGANLIGANLSLVSRLSRYAFLYRGGFASWTDCNLAGLRACYDLLDDDSRSLMDSFERLRGAPLPKRIVSLYRSGIYRQTAIGHFGLFLACLINRL